MRLSALSSDGAECSPAQFLFWFRKSYSKKTEALPSPAIVGLDETSNTPQPQAQASAALGARIRVADTMAARPWEEKAGMENLIERNDRRAPLRARSAGQRCLGSDEDGRGAGLLPP